MKRLLLMFLASAAAAFTVAKPNDASALWRRYSASFCMANGQDPHMDPAPPFPIGSVYGVRDNGVDPINLVCPVIDDSTFGRTTAKTLNLHGRDENTDDALTAKACYSQFNADFGGCNASKSTGVAATGTNVSLSFTSTTTVFPGSAADFGYIFVHVPSNGELRGYYTQDS